MTLREVLTYGTLQVKTSLFANQVCVRFLVIVLSWLKLCHCIFRFMGNRIREQSEKLSLRVIFVEAGYQLLYCTIITKVSTD